MATVSRAFKLGVGPCASAVRKLLFLFVLVGFVFSSSVNSQAVPMWTSPSGPGGAFHSAREACEAQWVKYGSPPFSRFLGARVHEDDFRYADCDWTRYQWLCPQETGAGFLCGTIIPGYVEFGCPSGYTLTADNHCLISPVIEQPACNCPTEGKINPDVGNPILLSTGAKILDAEDFSTADGDFRIGRRYRSFQVGRPIDGYSLPRSTPRWLIGGWNFDFGYEIQLGTFSGSPSSPNAKVAVLLPDGTGFGFVLQSSGQWIPDPAIGTARTPKNLKLEFVGTLPTNLADVKASTSTWKLTDRDDNVWTLQTRVGPNGGSYNTGWPTGKIARDGYQWTFAYNTDSSLASITDSFGRAATFTWNKFYITTLSSPPGGALPYPTAVAAIALPDGTSLKYTYDPPPATSAPSTSMIERLVKVERLSSASAVLDSTTYLYEDGRFPTHVTGVIDNRNIRIRTYAYDAEGRATSTQTANGNDSYTVEYGTSGSALTRRVTNALGKATNYTYSAFSSGSADYRLTQVAGEASAGTPTSTSSVDYGTDTFISSQTDEEGRVTTTTWDARARPTSIVEGDGTSSERTTTTTWHSTLNVPTSIVRDGVTETRSYNSVGQLTSVTETDTTSHTVPYSTNGQTRTTTYSWDANGRLLSINGPLAASSGNDDLTSFTYDTAGNLLTSTDALGHVTNFGAYDAGGRPGVMTDPNGIVTAFTYDGLGRVQTITVQHPSSSSLNATTTVGYDAVGQVTSVTLPSTDALIMDYDDADRLISMRAASGERRDYTYDALGNAVTQTVKRGDGSTSQRITRAFDELGRVLKETTGFSQTAHWAYDKVDNVIATTSPNGYATTSAFDALNRVVATVAPDSGSTSLIYDTRDDLLSHTDPISVTTQFVYDGFGDVIQEVSPDRGTSTYSYDAAGKLIQATDGRGQVVDYTRDYLGRITTKVPQSRPTSETITYYWDTGGLSGSYEVGRLAKIVDGSGTTKFQYDHRGNLLAKQQAIGSTTTAPLSYAYDLADRITQITYPSGRIVKYTYDSKGRVSSVETKASSSISSWTLLTNGYSYEPFGAVKTMTLGNGLAVANDWGNDGRLASRRLYHTVGGTDLSSLSYRYDADGNIGSITDQVNSSGSVLYGYDGNGRLTLATLDASGAIAQSFAYASGTNRLASVTDTAGTRSIAYDARGNTASETRAGSISATTGYDGYGRLISYSRTDTGTQSFTYNGLDDRVTMMVPAGTRNFIYDADGRVLGEYGASAADVKAEFIWMLPRAANDNAPFGGDDGVSGYAPLAVAAPDSGGTVQLNWVHGSHLGVPLVTTDAAGTPATTPNDYLAPGFPGQSKVLADLFYNRYRDYDPTTGRYIQADPIGLDGGSNPYLYAEANPLRGTDPEGLAPGGPYHPPAGVQLRCTDADSCAQIKAKMYVLMRMINSHEGWDRYNPRPRGGNRHAQEIAELWRAYARCQELLRKKHCDNCHPEDNTKKNLATAGGIAAGLYITYRIIRMIPSLVPPLWPTIPPNAIVP